MIDKLDLRIPRRTPFSPTFQRLYPELQALEKGPFRTGKYYEFAGDLREYGFNVRLNLFCRMEKEGNHKVELIDVGTLGKAEILQEVIQLFDINPLSLHIMRVDLAVDIPGVPLQWFRQTVRVGHKRFRAAVTGEPFYSEMGNGDIQTLYFGKRPNLLRLYDKGAEYDTQYRNALRKVAKGDEPPTFETVFGFARPETYLTRVERQIGGRIPEAVQTFGNLCSTEFSFKPFEQLQIIDHHMYPEPDVDASFETYCTGMYLRSIAENEGMQAVKAFISKRSNGNAAWVWKKYGPYLPSASQPLGLSGAALHQRFVESLQRQMSA